MNKFTLLLTLTFIVFTGCSAGTAMPSAPANTNTDVLTVTQTEFLTTSTALPTKTATTTPEPTLTLTPDNLGLANMSINCINLLQELPPNNNTIGRAVLTKPKLNGPNMGDYDTSDSWIDFPTGGISPISIPNNSAFYRYHISPNGQWLEYEKIIYSSDNRVESKWIIIENLNGEKVAEFQEEKTSNYFIASWLDNERLVVSDEGIPAIIDAFTGERVQMPEAYTNVLKDMDIFYNGNIKGVMDSKMERIFYPEIDTSLVLYDLLNNTIIYKSTPPNAFGPLEMPTWMKDDSKVIFTNFNIKGERSSDELFSLSRDGELTQLTFLNNYYDKSGIVYFSLSPDNKKVAFILFVKEYTYLQIGILDLATSRVTNYCDLVGGFGASRSPVWSPDSTKLLFERVENDDHTVHTVLLDMVNNYAAIVAENLSPEVWVNDAP